MPITSTQLHSLYLAYFGRPADASGAPFYLDNPAWTLQSVAAAFSASPESQALYGATFDGEDINLIYRNLFGRDAEQAGRDYWLGEISAGRLTPAQAAFAIMLGAQGADVTALNNKLQIAGAFFTALDTQAERDGYNGAASIAAARAFLATVNATAASVTAAQAGLAAAVNEAAGILPPELDGEFTAGVDNIVGTADADTFTATVSATGATFNAQDKLDGGAGQDTLNLILAAGLAADSVPAAQVSHVEIIAVTNLSSNVQTLDSRQFTAAARFVSSGSTAATTIGFLSANNVGGIANTNTAAGETSFVWGSSAAATAMLEVTGTNTGTVRIGGGITGAQVSATSDAAASMGGLIVDGADRSLQLSTGTVGLTVERIEMNGEVVAAGAGDLLIGALTAGIAKFDGSNCDGSITLNPGHGAAGTNFQFIGGRGNDHFYTHGAFAGTVAGGIGVDTLYVTDAAHIADAAHGADFTGFEHLAVMNGVTFDASRIAGVTGIQIHDGADATSVTGLTADQASNITIVSAQGENGGIELGLADTDGASVASIDLLPGSETPISLGRLTVEGVERIFLRSDAAYELELDAASLQNLQCTGSGSAHVTLAAAEFATQAIVTFGVATAAVTFDASQVTGAGVVFDGAVDHSNVVDDSAASDEIFGGAAQDTLTYHGGEGIIRLEGAGDRIDFSLVRGDVAMGDDGLDIYILASDSVIADTADDDGVFDAATAFDAALADEIIGIDNANPFGAGTGTRFNILTGLNGVPSIELAVTLTFGQAIAQKGFLLLDNHAAEANTAYLFQDTNESATIDVDDLMIRLVGNDRFDTLDEFNVEGTTLTYFSA